MLRNCSRCHSQLRISDIYCPYCSAGQGMAQSSPGNPFTGLLMIAGMAVIGFMLVFACFLSFLWLL